MPKLKPFTYHGKTETIGYHFFCPGCKSAHTVYTAEHGGGPVWGFNGDVEKPTFNPSLLLHRNLPVNDWPGTPQCHSFVKEGRIEFLGDSDHDLKGQTVEIPEWSDELWAT